MKHAIVGACVILACLATLIQQSEAEKDLAKLQGEWICVLVKVGRNTDESRKGKLLLKVTGNKAEGFNPSGESEGVARIKLDPTNTPKHIDFTSFKNGRVRTVLGLYSIEGDKLTICSNGGEGPRPAKLAEPNGANPDERYFVVRKKKR